MTENQNLDYTVDTEKEMAGFTVSKVDGVDVSPQVEAPQAEAPQEDTTVSDELPTVDETIVQPDVPEDTPQGSEVEEPSEDVFTIEDTTPPLAEPVVPQVQAELPEGVDALVKFINDTGGTVEDYLNLNRDVDSLDEVTVIKEYYKSKHPHLNDEDIEFKMDEQFQYDEDKDEERSVRLKKLAFKEELYNAKNHLLEQKDKHYRELRANKPDASIESIQRQEEALRVRDEFENTTKQFFSNNFEGFDFGIGENKVGKVKIGNIEQTMKSQSSLDGVLGSYFNEQGELSDPKGYHKAIYAAANPDKLAQHFFQLGQSQAIRTEAESSKNIDMGARKQTVPKQEGTSWKVLNDDDTKGWKF
ncbi:MAG: hypothetical protein K0U41_02130 [Gammaproteobacteria bacterium]|nr:hypothetical protein [Gammaproteobacteria bacterium]